MQNRVRVAAVALLAGCGVPLAVAADGPEKAAAPAAVSPPAAAPEKAAAKLADEPAPLIHDHRIHGQAVKISVGQRLEVRVSGGCSWHLVAIGGDSVEAFGEGEVTERGEHNFAFRGRRPGRSRVVLCRHGPGGKDLEVDFAAEVSGPGKPSDPADVPLFLFGGADGGSFTVPVGRKVEWRLPTHDDGGGWKLGGIEGKSVRHDADPAAKPGAPAAPATLLRFTSVKEGGASVTVEWVNAPGKTLSISSKVIIDVKPAVKGLAPDSF
jgi:hypothetical protein